MKRVLIFCSLLAFCEAGLALNNQDVVEFSVVKESEPVWKGLERLSLAEKENAILEIELPSDTPLEAIEHSRLVESKWNSGDYDGAIELFRGFTDLYDAACGIQWKEPIKTESKWGDDVQIGNEDSIYVVALDVDNTTGNLFSALLYPDGSFYKWDVYISQDTGKTWSRTYTWGPNSYYPTDIDGVVAGNHFYVAYIYEGAPTKGRIRRFYTSDGSGDAAYGYQDAFDEGTNVKDIALASNADYYDDRIYYLAILTNDSLKYYWDDTTATSWTPVDPGIENADRGLDACYNEGYSTYWLWVSYIGTDDSLYVSARSPWHHFGALDYASPPSSYCVSSISAYKDTVITVFYHQGVSNPWIKYRISYDGGTTWDWGSIGDTTYICRAPNVTCRGGDGMGVVYQSRLGTIAYHGMFTWSNYSGDP